MDIAHFDDLARAVVGGGTRRAAVRLLAGSALGTLAARLGLAGDASAKTRRHQPARHERQNQERPLQTAAKKKGKKKHKPKPPPAEFACGSFRCQILAVDTDEQESTMQPCQLDGTGLSVCEEAKDNQQVRALSTYLRKAGFVPAGGSHPAGDFVTVFDDGAITDRVIVLPFAKRGGQEALVRYGVGTDENQAPYALMQDGGAPVAVLTVDADGRIVTLPVEETAGAPRRGKQSGRIKARSGKVGAASDPDHPNHHEGQADELCFECPIVCKALGSIECGLLVLSRTGNPLTALLSSKICEKPAEAGCGPYCKSMIGPLLEDDPRNCGACGQTCSVGSECCQSGCIDTRHDPQNCGACGNQCPNGTTCCNGTCVDLQTDPNFCGVCGNRCTGDKGTCCGGRCVDTDTDYRHCGECDSFCGGYEEQCVSGVCQRPTCPPARRCGFGYCCPEGTSCGGGSCCSGGSCECIPGFFYCNGKCCRDGTRDTCC